MQIEIQTAAVVEVVADVLVFICFECSGTETECEPEWVSQSGWRQELQERGEFRGELYDSAMLHRPAGLAARRLLLVGGGERKAYTKRRAQRLGGMIARYARDKRLCRIALYADDGGSCDADADIVEALVEGAMLGSWEPGKYKTCRSDEWSGQATFSVIVPDAGSEELRAAAQRGRIVSEAQNVARELVSEPPNLQLPADLARSAAEVEAFGVAVEVLDQAQMAALGMGALLGVSQGSDNAPFLVVLRYYPQKGIDGIHLALIGKGVTFDTGGISIKAPDEMPEMKYDMAGAATVIAAMRAIGQLRPAIRVTGYIAAVENMIGGNAQRPGDIVTTLSGKTVEVVNTDAEGRLVLADAITYAKQNGATHIVDAGTLTHAIDVALGRQYIGVFTNAPAFLARYSECARVAEESIWELPLPEEYRALLGSSFADLKNIGGPAAGAITAAEFLRAFADPTPWIHLDIAATAWLDEEQAWSAKGPTGVGVRSMVRLALDGPSIGG